MRHFITFKPIASVKHKGGMPMLKGLPVVACETITVCAHKAKSGQAKQNAKLNITVTGDKIEIRLHTNKSQYYLLGEILSTAEIK